ncbi:hypothetical protein I547_2204 [Mycobacterium kansasii 824]|nr:hypothetical protein I547_2204 [Mycobacterium kansasii 824]
MWSPCRSAPRCGVPTSRRTPVCCWRSSTPSPSTARRRWPSPTTPTPAARSRSPRSQRRKPPTAIPLRHEGLAYRFPFHTEKKSYPYFDPIAQKAFDANYDSQEDVNGLTTYRFTQNVGYGSDGKLVAPIKYPSLYAGDEDGKITTTAAMWGVPGEPGEQITMNRYYAAQRTFWVDPVTGTIVKETERAYHYYAREAMKPEVTLADYKVTSTEETVESQVNTARDERDRLALWSRVLPITFTAVGLIALVGGGLLASFSLRTESALTEPGLDRDDTDYFRRAGLAEPVPGAEAETEKLPTQRPELPADPATPRRSRPRPRRPRPSRHRNPDRLSLPRGTDLTRRRALVATGLCVGSGATGAAAAPATRISAIA